MTDTSQIFISYKSEDVEVVRPLAQALLANGLNVWFNEYKMTSPECWSEENIVHETLEKAVAESGTVVICASNEWASSGYCATEFRTAMESLASKRIIVVELPQGDSPSREYMERLAVIKNMSSHHRVEYAKSSKSLLESVAPLLSSERIEARMPNEPKRLFDRNPLVLKVSKHLDRTIGFAWRGTPDFMRPRVLSKISIPLGSYRASVLGKLFQAVFPSMRGDPHHHTLWTTMDGKISSASIDYYPAGTIGPIREMLDQGVRDERLVYRKLVEHAGWWVREGRGNKDSGGEIIGVHLVKGARVTPQAERATKGHFGTTVRIDYGSGRGMVAWIRKYAFLVPLDAKTTGQLDVDFLFFLPKTGKDTEFVLFCQLIGRVEQLVGSIQAD